MPLHLFPLVRVSSFTFVDRFVRVVPVVVILAMVATSIAQFAANNQVNPQLAPANTQARNYRPNDYSVGESIHYRRPPYQTAILPSEARMAAQRSGALPSELRMNAQQAGPLNPAGAVAYIPGQSTIQQLMRLPPPQLYNPAYHISPQLGQSEVGSPGNGSVAYSGTYRRPLNVPPPTSNLQRVTPQPTRTTYTQASWRPPGVSSNSIAPSPPTAELAPEELPPPSLGYGSIYFSSISPPSSIR